VPSPGAVSQTRGTETPLGCEFGILRYPDPALRVFTCYDRFGAGAERPERTFFVGYDGMVYEDRVGRSFDGAEIDSYIRSSFTHLGSPGLRKYFRRADIELNALETYAVDMELELQVGHEIDFGSSHVSSAIGTVEDGAADVDIVEGAGPDEIAEYGDPIWTQLNVRLDAARAELNGTGENVSISIRHTSAYDDPFIVQGATIHYDLRRIQR
jgi:hypothetical protein